MGRKKLALDDELIVARMAQGWTAAEMAKEQGVSTSTMVRRAQALKGRVREVKVAAVKARREAAAPESSDAMPCDVPTDLTLEDYDRLIERATRNSKEAEDADEHAAAQGWARVALAAMTERRKATPPPKTDPNELPDMVAAARRARETLHKLVMTSPEGE